MSKWPKAYTSPDFREMVLEDYKHMSRLPNALVDIAVRASVYSSTYSTPNAAKGVVETSSLAMAFHEGRRSLALEILELAEIDHRQLQRILKTAQEK